MGNIRASRQRVSHCCNTMRTRKLQEENVEKILVVDDEQEVVTLVSDFLVTAGYDVRSVADSRDAVALFESFRPGLCLVDLSMPGLSGVEVFKEFVRIDSTVETIFLLAENETDVALNLMRTGASDLLVKPIRLEYLAVSVVRALEHRQLLLDNLYYRNHVEDLIREKTDSLTDALSSLVGMHAGMLDTLGMALDFRDQSTSGHSRRVALWTTDIARKIGISGDSLAQVERGALLHDIGKLKIPDSILLKPGPLDSQEWRIMRRHCEYGRQFLDRIEFLRPAAALVYAHHEKFDGSGYPRGLVREAIPLGARCFAIMDAVDAMMFKRPYNKPVSFDRAAAEINRCAGTHFDPEIVDVALPYLSVNIATTETS